MRSRGIWISGVALSRTLAAIFIAACASIAALEIFFAQRPGQFPQFAAGAVVADSYTEQTEVVDPAPPSIAIRTTLEHNGTVFAYLRETGLNQAQARRWAADFADSANTSILRQGHTLTIYKSPETGDLTGLKYDLDDNNQILEANLGNDIIKSFKEPIRYNIRPVSVDFAVRNDFRTAAIRNRIPRSIVKMVENAFASRADLNHLGAGTGVKLIFSEKVSRDGSYSEPGHVDAAEISFGSHALMAFALRDEQGREHLYDAQGQALGPQQSLRFPLKFEYISSGFTMHRYHPILHEYRPHVGVDLAARYGTPVKAIADGKIETAGWCGELGNCVRIQHENETTSIYGHLSKISQQLKPGTFVRMGEVIGQVGSSGLSTGPHLHFGMEKEGTYVDPLNQVLGVHHEVSPRMQALFQDIKERYQAALAKLPNLSSGFASDAGQGPISPLDVIYHRRHRHRQSRTLARRRSSREA